jgi:hypothetical protein
MLHEPSIIRPGTPVSAAHARAVVGAAMGAGLAQAAPGLYPSRRGIVSAPRRTDASPPAWSGARGFPWGSQWAWGFEFVVVSDVLCFRLHRASLSIGNTTWSAIVNDGGSGSSLRRATIDISSVVSGEWGLAVELDWDSGAPRWGAELVLFSSESAMQAQDAQTETSSPYRIPVAWFSGRTLLRDRVHGVLYPQVWTEPA